VARDRRIHGTLSAAGIGPEPAPRHRIVTFQVQEDEGEADGPAVRRGTDVRLTVDGVELFGDVYAVGELFDDLAFEV
jgi:hypothetical protein